MPQIGKYIYQRLELNAINRGLVLPLSKRLIRTMFHREVVHLHRLVLLCIRHTTRSTTVEEEGDRLGREDKAIPSSILVRYVVWPIPFPHVHWYYNAIYFNCTGIKLML